MRRCRTPTLIEIYGYTGTICGYWGAHESDLPPWNDTALAVFSYDKIDKLLLTTYGNRPISPFLSQYVDDDGTISSSAAQYIARYLLDMFRPQWARLTADFTAQYNPIENYDLTETENIVVQASGTDTGTESYTNYKETQKYGHTVTTDANAGVYGFNSGSAVPADESTTTTAYGDSGDTGDTREVEGTRGNSMQYGKKDETDRDFRRHGNIGVQTPTDMIIRDTEFWSSNNFYSQVAADIASVLTIPIYE